LKKLLPVYFLVVFIFLMVPVSAVFAYEGGVLQGKGAAYGPEFNPAIDSFPEIGYTDGIDASSVAHTGNGGSNDTIWVKIGEVTDNITSYRIKQLIMLHRN
jgi:hypothetical protein